MNNPAYSGLATSVRFRSNGFTTSDDNEAKINPTDSQERLPGFDQQMLRAARIHMIGCGGIGTAILENLVRKGCGHVDIFDGDDVEWSNLGRQKFFPSDVGQNKAVSGARNALRHASWQTEIVAHPCWFEDAVRRGIVGGATAAVVGPDRDSARVFASRYFYKMCASIFVGIGTKVEHGYVFVQKPGSACFGCLFPDAVTDQRKPCPGTPAMVDILLVTAGLVLTALDSVLMKGRKIEWNYWDIYPSGMIPTKPLTVERRMDCPICGRLN